MPVTIGEVTLTTEVDYWKFNHFLGGMIYQLEHDASHGHIDLPGNVVDSTLDKQRQLQQKILEGLRTDFNVILPQDPEYPKDFPPDQIPDPPVGKKWYWVWYREMKEQIFGWEYDHLICSACPFTYGRDNYIDLNSGRYPCQLILGWSKVRQPSQCGWARTIRGHEQDPNRLIAGRILTDHGKEAAAAFAAKQTELQQMEADGTLKTEFGY